MIWLKRIVLADVFEGVLGVSNQDPETKTGARFIIGSSRKEGGERNM